MNNMDRQRKSPPKDLNDWRTTNTVETANDMVKQTWAEQWTLMWLMNVSAGKQLRVTPYKKRDGRWTIHTNWVTTGQRTPDKVSSQVWRGTLGQFAPVYLPAEISGEVTSGWFVPTNLSWWSTDEGRMTRFKWSTDTSSCFQLMLLVKVLCFLG